MATGGSSCGASWLRPERELLSPWGRAPSSRPGRLVSRHPNSTPAWGSAAAARAVASGLGWGSAARCRTRFATRPLSYQNRRSLLIRRPRPRGAVKTSAVVWLRSSRVLANRMPGRSRVANLSATACRSLCPPEGGGIRRRWARLFRSAVSALSPTEHPTRNREESSVAVPRDVTRKLRAPIFLLIICPISTLPNRLVLGVRRAQRTIPWVAL